MFGPDKCGGNNKVHFIFRHQNPKSKVFEEKHLKDHPPSQVEKGKTNLYTLIVRKDQSFEILINNNTVKKGSLLEDFEPSVNPPKEIDDKDDKKPDDWVDEAKIADPEAKKPEDWDDDAPVEILDEDATIPTDWLVDEPKTIPDPESVKPEDWDEEEDGDWTAPSVPNPACENVSGCGEWVRPTKKNPNYKGVWKAPLIDNPAYKGVWAPKKIANPDYFEDKTPSNFNKIGAIGFELWSMQDAFLFDNIYVGHSVDDAKKLAEETWVVKHDIEKKQAPVAEPEAQGDRPVSDNAYVAVAQKTLYAAQDLFEKTKVEALEFIDLAKNDPVLAVKVMPHIAGLFVSLALVPVLLLSLLFGGSKKPVKKVKSDADAPKGDVEPQAVKKSEATKRTPKKKD